MDTPNINQDKDGGTREVSEDYVDITESCTIEVLVPEASDFDPKTLSRSKENPEQAQDEQPSISAVRRRNFIYFDELISTYLILQTPYREKSLLKGLINRLTITLEVIALDSNLQPPYGRETQQPVLHSAARDVLWSGQVDTKVEPVVIDEGADQDEKHVLKIIWKIPVPVGRPRIRLQSPLVTCRPSAVARATRNSGSDRHGERYLPSGIPTSVNLLESLKYEPGLNGIEPRLPALRLSRINGSDSGLGPNDRSLRITAQATFNLVPAITARVRYSKASNIAGKHAMIASIDIETVNSLDREVSLQTVRMRLSEGSAENLGNGFNPVLPMKSRPRDCVTFLFRLTPNESLSYDTNSASNSRALDIEIYGNVRVSASCQPRIQMHWRTGVDFSTTLNASFGAPSQSMQRTKRPANIAISQTTPNEVVTPGPGQVKDAEGLIRRGRTASLDNLGINMTFTAPSDVYIGEPFNLDVFVVNRSSKPRKLAVLVVPKRKKVDLKTNLSRLSTSSAGGRKDGGVAEALMDENLLYALQRNAAKEAVQIISLSNDTIIGPLHPGSCFNADLKLLPLAAGYLQIDTVRVVDVATNSSVDVRDLPDIIAQERSTKAEEENR